MHAVLDGWDARPGPRYARLAAAVADAVSGGRVPAGARLPAERLLADAVGVSRGTVVAAVEQLVQAGVVRRRQGSGTTVVGAPGGPERWSGPRADSPVAALLRRRREPGDGVDLSLSVPSGTEHLPPVPVPSPLPTGRGLAPAGLPELRAAVADHLTVRHGLPTRPDDLVITAGAQQALTLLAAATARPRVSVLTACPTYPGLFSAVAGARRTIVAVPDDGPAGMDTAAARALRSAPEAVVYVMSTGANPTGAVLPLPRREALVAAARAAGALLVDDLALADLVLEDRAPPPLAALDPGVVTIGSLSKVLWAGLRVGWIRAPEPLRSGLVRLKSATDLATSVPSQVLAADLLAAVDDEWLARRRAVLRARRDHLAGRLAAALPAWAAPERPLAGLSLWVRLPVHDADAFTDAAAAHGVAVANGSALCACGRHRPFVRLSFAEDPEALDVAVERLEAAWQHHCADVAATPAG